MQCTDALLLDVPGPTGSYRSICAHPGPSIHELMTSRPIPLIGKAVALHGLPCFYPEGTDAFITMSRTHLYHLRGNRVEVAELLRVEGHVFKIHYDMVSLVGV